MALHIPWDQVDDYAALAAYAADLGVALGTINANIFQDDDYMLGSVTNPDPAVRRKAIDHLLECVDVMDATGSRDLKLWFADGTNYPGQDDIRARQDRLAEALREVYDRLGDDQRLVLEYKFFEPAFYTTDVPDWGTVVRALPGARASRRRSCVDTGHHAPGTNIEFIVALLLRPGKLGAFDFNSPLLRRRRPDGRRGRPVPAVPDPVRGRPRRRLGAGHRHRVHARPVPQHRAEDPGQIRSVLNVQEATAQGAARRPRRAGRGAARRRRARRQRRPAWTPTTPTSGRCSPSCATDRGLARDPMARLRRARGYQEQIVADRVGGTARPDGARDHARDRPT